MVADWTSLALLPVFKRSFGPVYPSLLSLALVRVLLLIVSGVAGVDGYAGIFIALGLQVLIFGISFYSLWIEPANIKVSTQKFITTKLSKRIRLLHLSDLHLERIGVREQKLLALLDKLKPDVIVFTGDFLNLSYNQDPETLWQVKCCIENWRAPLGTFAVSGSPQVESLSLIRSLLGDTHIHHLENATHRIDTAFGNVSVSGVTCLHNTDKDSAQVNMLAELLSESDLNILLYHSPDISPAIASAGYELFLCGHTHGGQVRIPGYGALITSSELGKQFESGRYSLLNTEMYVSRGIGLEGGAAPRIRLFCPPEIIVWEIGPD